MRRYPASSSWRGRWPALALGLVLGCAASVSSALDGFFYAVSCNTCQTTAEFQAAARSQAGFTENGGTYLVVSNAVARSAYMQVTGHIVNVGGEPVWRPTAATPVDSSGNSLAGQPESTLQNDYTAIDLITIGIDRNLPVVINVTTGTYWEMSDDEITNLINGYLASQGISSPPVAVTLEFISNHSAAKFVYNSTTHRWSFVVGYDAQGHQLDRNGQPTGSNPNKAGTGGGQAQANGFGRYAGPLAQIIGENNCTFVTTITLGDGSIAGMHVGPC